MYRGTKARVYPITIEDEDEQARDTSGYEVRYRILEYKGDNVLFDKICTLVNHATGSWSIAPRDTELPDVGVYRGSLHLQTASDGLVPVSALSYNEPYSRFPVIILDSNDIAIANRAFDGIGVSGRRRNRSSSASDFSDVARLIHFPADTCQPP